MRRALSLGLLPLSCFWLLLESTLLFGRASSLRETFRTGVQLGFAAFNLEALWSACAMLHVVCCGRDSLRSPCLLATWMYAAVVLCLWLPRERGSKPNKSLCVGCHLDGKQPPTVGWLLKALQLRKGRPALGLVLRLQCCDDTGYLVYPEVPGVGVRPD